MTRIIWKYCFGVLACLGLLSAPHRAAAQINNWFYVDCSGQYQGLYPSIYSVISDPNFKDGSGILFVTSFPCDGGIPISNLRNIFLGGLYGESPTVQYIDIEDSDLVYVANLNVQPNGIYVKNSRDVMIDSSSSSNNHGAGLHITGASAVTVQGGSTFDFNGGYGIRVEQNSMLNLMGWNVQPIDISSNGGVGLSIDRSTFQSTGNVSITNNSGGYGMEMLGHSTGLMISAFGPHTISGNPNGGVHVGETSQLSIGGNPEWGAPYPNIIQGNGPVGILAELLGQVTLFGLTQVLDHTVAGVDVYGNSQVDLFNGVNQITHDGFGTEPARAGIRVNENSHAYVRGAEIMYNGGPGILDLVNSTVDIAGSTFSSNAGGPVACDGTAFVVSDLKPAALGSANSCKTANASGAKHQLTAPKFSVSDWKKQKARADKMRAMVPHFHR